MLFSPRPAFDTSSLPSLGGLSTNTPFLFLPVRVQVKFMRDTSELYVRIYPDQLSIDYHETDLTDSEVLAGQQYWRQSLTSPDRAPNTAHSLLAWQVLIGRYGANRASWIVERTKPNSTSTILAELVERSDSIRGSLEVPKPEDWPDDFYQKLATSFPKHEANKSAWKNKALAKCLPDRFVVALYNKIPNVSDVQDAYMKEQVINNFSITYNSGDTDLSVQTGTAQGVIVIPPHESGPKVPILDQGRYENYIVDLTAEFLEVVKVQVGNDIQDHEIAVGMSGGDIGASLNEESGLDGELLWLSDFRQAVKMGMGLIIPLDPKEFDKGFDRLVVIGVRAGADEQKEADQLSELLQAHAHTNGLELVPQGTPTNNTGGTGAGYSSAEQYDAEASFKMLLQSPLYKIMPPDAPQQELQDGQRLAQALGLPADRFVHTGHAGDTDGQEAALFNQVLWPATFGYFMREMLEPMACTPEVTAQTRRFFEQYVTGRGPLPNFRVGNVPYGVLLTTWFSQWEPLKKELEEFGELSWDTIRRLDVTWTERLNEFALYPPDFHKETPFPSPPPSQQDILTVLGQDAASVEFYQRYFVGPSLMDTLAHRAEDLNNKNGSNLHVWAPQFDLGGIRRNPSPRENLPARYQGEPENPLYSNFLTFFSPTKKVRQQSALREWSYAFDVNYQIGYRKIVHTYADEPKPQPEVVGPIVDSAPISEVNRIKPLRPDRNAGVDSDPNDPELRNYVHWLADSTFDEIYTQDFRREFSPDRNNPDDAQIPDNFELPNSLLYHSLRQAVMWRYWEAGEAVLREKNIQIPRQETELFNILNQNPARWQWLYNRNEWGGIPLYEWLLTDGHPEAQALQQYLKTLHSLATLPTARLERLLAEHLDLGNHRLDAWKTGQVLVRLLTQRQQRPKGIYLGAFGWLEKVHAQDESTPNDEGNREDPDNLGYIHAPSINHGVAAAVLRQGYKSRQFPSDIQDPTSNRMAVNLSSERVRRALALMEGIRTGNSLSALLGRDFEEGLFNATPSGSGPSYGLQIEAFRQLYPHYEENAAPGQAPRTPAPELDARQLVDGLRLVKAKVLNRLPPLFVNYPSKNAFNLGTITPQVFWDAVLRQVDELQNTLDALGDLTVGESIYQAVSGNVEQAAAMLESVAKGNFPASPDVVHPNRAGATLTHRVLLHLPQKSPDRLLTQWKPAKESALARTEPALNNWLVTFFGDPEEIQIPFTYRLGEVTLQESSISLRELGWQPIDFLLMLDPEALRPGSAFDAHVAHTVRLGYTGTPVDEFHVGTVTVAYENLGALKSMGPLLGRLRQLLATSRPATANDLTAPGRLAPGQVTDEKGGVEEQDAQQRLEPIEEDFARAKEQILTLVAPLKGAQDPLPKADLKELRAELHKWGEYNLPEAYLAASPAANDPVGAAEAVVALLQRRLDAATRAKAEPNLAIRYAEVAKSLLGSSFHLSLPFNLPTTASSESPVSPYTAYTEAFAANGSLMRKYPGNPFIVEEWLQGLAPVRDSMHHLEKVILLNELLWDGDEAHALPALTPTQMSTRTPPNGGEYWLGVEYPSVAEGYTPPNDAVSLVQMLPSGYNENDRQQALWLDEWVELIPDAVEDTSLVFHYDQPNMEAPQSVLLAVAPIAEEKEWDWEMLFGTVSESLDFAKKRAVEPGNLAATHLGALLPALVAPVAQEEVTMTLDLRKLIGLPQFGGVPYLPTPGL